MAVRPEGPLKTGFTTGACATAAAAAATGLLLNGDKDEKVLVQLPKGQEVWFDIAQANSGDGWAEIGVIKDAGDDPDVTHGALILARVAHGMPGSGITFAAGAGVGTVTKPGLPIGVGEPAINPVPRQMIGGAVTRIAQARGVAPDFKITVSVPGGEEIAASTWNPRLGIVGGLSILGTTGIVRPFSCSSWIASIHRGVDVARAANEPHVCGATGNMSEKAAQEHLSLPDHAMLDMGDFAGGVLKYIARHPIARLTIAGGFGKLVKLAQGAMDLHSARSQVDFAILAEWAENPDVAQANTAAQALEMVPGLAPLVAQRAATRARTVLGEAPVGVDVMVVSRSGEILAVSEVLD